MLAKIPPLIQSPLILQGGPPSSYKWGYNSIYKGYNSSYPFIRPFIGVITLFITCRGPPCKTVPPISSSLGKKLRPVVKLGKSRTFKKFILQRISFGVPSSKPTRLAGKHLQMVAFHSHVSFRECNTATYN